MIFYTSGTTGRPKGAITTHRTMIANLQNTVFIVTADAMLGGRHGDARTPPGRPARRLFTSPLFHVSGCHSTLVVGFDGRHEARDGRGPVRPDDGVGAHRGRTA